MKNIGILFLLLIITNTLLFSQAKNKIQAVKERGYIVVGMTAVDQPPFYFKNKNGEMVGLDVDIANTIAQKIGVNLVINRDAKSFNDLIPLVVNETIDFASSKLSKTLTRASRVLYSQPYLVFRQAMLINRVRLASISSDDKKTMKFLKQFNASLGVIENSSYERYAAINFPNATVNPYRTWEDAIAAVVDGKVFAIYRDELELTKVMLRDPENNLILKIVVFADQKDPIAIAIHPAKHHFVYYINTVLDAMNIEQNIKKLIQSYSND